MDDEQKKFIEEDTRYFRGKQNFLIRMYFYLQNGLNMLNDFHNIFLGMLTLAITFRITSVPVIAAILVPSFFIFLILGYYNVHRLSKMREWLNLRFSTHFGIQQFNFTEGQYKLLVEIRDLLKKIDDQNGRQK